MYQAGLWLFSLGVLCLGFLNTAHAASNPGRMLLDPATRVEGMEALNSMGANKAHRSVMVVLAEIQDDEEGRRIMMQTLAQAGEAGYRSLALIATGEDVELAETAYRSLMVAEQSSRIHDDMKRRISEGRPMSLALMAIENFAQTGVKSAVPLFERVIPDESIPIELRTSAIFGLGRLAGPKSTRFLNLVYQRSKLGMTPRHLQLRRTIVMALAQLDTQDSVPTLIDALRVEALWPTAVEALVAMGDKVVPALRLVLETDDTHVEPGVLAVLFRLGKIDSQRFVSMLSSNDSDRRNKARWILSSFPDDQIVSEFIELWNKQTAYPTRMEILDLLALHYKDRRVRKIFEDNLSSPKVELKIRALEIVVGEQDRSFEKIVLDMAENDRLNEMRIRAIDAMVYLGLDHGRTLLERMVQYEDADVIQAAIRGLAWLGNASRSPAALHKTIGLRDSKLLNRLIHTEARLTGQIEVPGASPKHYVNVGRFKAKAALSRFDVDTSVLTVNGEKLRLYRFGSGPGLIVYLPLPYSSPAVLLAGLKGLGEHRTVVMFQKVGGRNVPPYSVNASVDVWMSRSTEAIKKHMKWKGSVDVLGWSLGAVWATRQCHRNPADCRSLILASPLSLNPEFWRSSEGLIRANLPSTMVPDFDFLVQRVGQFHPMAYADYYEEFMAGSFFHKGSSAIPLVEAGHPFLIKLPEVPILDITRTLEDLARGAIPVVSIFGDTDPYSNEWFDALSMLKTNEEIPVTVQIIPEAGHMAVFEQPKSVSSFLERLVEPED
jgi:pimeloyl-ACP methyl ester carboxylesterase/HEAT repeat protein